MRKAIYLFAALIVVVLSCNKEEHYIKARDKNWFFLVRHITLCLQF